MNKTKTRVNLKLKLHFKNKNETEYENLENNRFNSQIRTKHFNRNKNYLIYLKILTHEQKYFKINFNKL